MRRRRVSVRLFPDVIERGRNRWTHAGCARHFVSGFTGRCQPANRHWMTEFALQTAQVIDQIPAIGFFDSVVRRHYPAAVSDQAEQVSVAELLGLVSQEARRKEVVFLSPY